MNASEIANNWVDFAKSKFVSAGNNRDALAMAAYMKNNFLFYGIKKPIRALITKEIFQEQGLPGQFEFRKITELLWDEPYRELHYLALEILFRNKKHFVQDDILLFEEMMRSKSWWDSIDYISPTLCYHLFRHYPLLKFPTLQKWNSDKNFWIRRASIIAQLKEKKETDIELQFRLISTQLHEKEFFIRKAIGWSLREMAKSFPNEVKTFVNSNELSPLSKKEALKYFRNIN